MNEIQAQQLRNTLALLRETRGVDALHTLGAVAGIPSSRMKQLAAGEGAPPTTMEYSTIMMLR